MTATRQETYSLAQRLKNTSRLGQAAILRTNGAVIRSGSQAADDRLDRDAQLWWITMHGISGEGFSHAEALQNWIWWAELHHRNDVTRRATDGRVDCPFGGQGLPEDAQRQTTYDARLFLRTAAQADTVVGPVDGQNHRPFPPKCHPIG